ncbi:MAG: cobyrinate a,c-diamide synthase [Thermodesulfobacteria bacterium]|nr:cobyrinate a,c-diamide synthase [Thermodesulfobacteriota bacterium]
MEHKIEQPQIPAFTIAALRGGSGKTIASLGIARALSNQSKRVVCFKKGPDYIDAAWLAAASNDQCYNLDPFLMDVETIKASFQLRSQERDVAIIEGNRGLFDGMDLEGTASTSKLSRLLDAPVLLVIDCTKATRTIAALVKGCLTFEPEVNFLGVILNQVAGKRHIAMVTQAIEHYTGLPVLGFIPRLKKDPLPMRHLGLTPTDEFQGASSALDELATLAQEHMDIDRIINLASRRAPNLGSATDLNTLFGIEGPKYSGLKIGVIRDAAFQFYYPENLEALSLLGAELKYLNAISDRRVPEVDGIYIGGGFPETQAALLEKNIEFRKNLLELINNGLPVYAECGGLMYLGHSILWQNEKYEMVGAIPFDLKMQQKPAGHGYTIMEFQKDTPFYKRGAVVKGHEFHYSRPIPKDSITSLGFACKLRRGSGFQDKLEGYVNKNVFCTYTHVHALGQKEWASTFLNGVAKIKGLEINGKPGM